jgi:hypothetical protein
MNYFFCKLIILLKICSLLLLISLFVLVITIIITIIIGICNKSWCQINTNVSVSLDGGTTYTNNFSYINFRKVIYLKYEISARIDSFLPRSIFYKIPFHIEIPEQGMDVILHEYSGICNPTPGKNFAISNKTEFAVYANRKRTEKVKITLKCKRNSTDTLFAFKLMFKNKQLERYSKAIAFEIYGTKKEKHP